MNGEKCTETFLWSAENYWIFASAASVHPHHSKLQCYNMPGSAITRTPYFMMCCYLHLVSVHTLHAVQWNYYFQLDAKPQLWVMKQFEMLVGWNEPFVGYCPLSREILVFQQGTCTAKCFGQKLFLVMQTRNLSKWKNTSLIYTNPFPGAWRCVYSFPSRCGWNILLASIQPLCDTKPLKDPFSWRVHLQGGSVESAVQGL